MGKVHPSVGNILPLGETLSKTATQVLKIFSWKSQIRAYTLWHYTMLTEMVIDVVEMANLPGLKLKSVVDYNVFMKAWIYPVTQRLLHIGLQLATLRLQTLMAELNEEGTLAQQMDENMRAQAKKIAPYLGISFAYTLLYRNGLTQRAMVLKFHKTMNVTSVMNHATSSMRQGSAATHLSALEAQLNQLSALQTEHAPAATATYPATKPAMEDIH